MSAPKVDQSGFQLDKKELTHDLPLMARGIAEGLIGWVNGLDTNHDGKADIAQLAPYVIKMVPTLQGFAPHIDPNEFIEWVCEHKWVINKAALKALLVEAFKLVLEAQKEVK